MNIFADFRTRIENSIHELINQGVIEDGADLSRISVEPPREESHGDMATNAAMVLGKFSELQPRDLASKIAELLSCDFIICTLQQTRQCITNNSTTRMTYMHRASRIG